MTLKHFGHHDTADTFASIKYDYFRTEQEIDMVTHIGWKLACLLHLMCAIMAILLQPLTTTTLDRGSHAVATNHSAKPPKTARISQGNLTESQEIPAGPKSPRYQSEKAT